ncbi:DUF2798 domain-containing protein [Asticcacaulis sp. 201]|uniref:DUF2798 domain-containing protein n=1 Tax=Asticcacaulis sp. 201 TaxID=3028787 RepID=UPI0029161F9F|nr:DUF2798 domain-containing protein [Asticcacaulis sp. 201]MDV6332763.1 DUF2798 domain-containing protein [Asticcacaulis sp. 201]
MKLTKLPAKYATLVMPLLLSVMMTFVVSAISTFKNIGFADNFAAHWMSAWGMSWVIAFPTLLLALPLVRRVVAMIVAPSQA